ncbi:MAG: molybdopterin cofactor-binding domain-containing protein [Pseudomonadota bacterium]
MGKWTRRAFITAGVLVGGGAIFGVAMRPGNLALGLQDSVADGDETLVHSFVKIDADNVITAITPHAELGQGAQTALAQMLAEELDADWDKVRIEEAPAMKEYAAASIGRGILLAGVDLPGFVVPTVEGVMIRVASAMDLQVTGGSLSIRTTGVYGMRVAGAATRDMLMEAASKAWGVPVRELTTDKSHVIHAASDRSEPYATFAAAAAKMTPSYTPTLKDASEFKIVGTSVERLDIPSKVDGTAKFALDVRVPDLVYATSRRAPVFGGAIASLDDSAARALPGVIDVIRLPSSSNDGVIGSYEPTGESVAVVADSYWTARRGLDALEITWDDKGLGGVSDETIYAQHAETLTAAEGREADRETGDLDATFDTAAQVIEAEYRVPYLAHTCMEPMNATAHVADGKAEIWVGCQNPLGFRRFVAEVLDLDEENVTLHNHFMGGGFGRKALPDATVQVARVSQALGRPVQLIWSREEDIRQDFYRPASISRFRGALDADGALIGWQNSYVNKMEPQEAPLIPYGVPTQDIGFVQSPSHVPWGAWRSVDESQHGFYTESFIDECAAAAGQDAYAFRAALLSEHPRHRAVLDRAAKEAGWETPLPPNRGRGIALKESFGSIVAQVVEVTLNDSDISIDRVVGVIDLGQAVTPDGVAAQIESGIVYGLTAAIFGQINIEDGAVTQSNFHDYEAMRMSTAPVIETHIINSGHPIGGAGEPGTPPAAAALANAIFAVTGTRIRDLPMINHLSFSAGGLYA